MLSTDQWLVLGGILATIAAALIGGLFVIRARKREAAQSSVQRGNTNASIQVGSAHMHFHAAPPTPAAPAPLPIVSPNWLQSPAVKGTPIVESDQKTRQGSAARIDKIEPIVPAPAQVRRRPRKVKLVACDNGPYDASPGGETQVELDIEAGDRLVGQLQADSDFEFEVLNGRNYTLKHDDENYTAIADGEGSRVYHVDVKIPRGRGPWYLVLEAYGKKNSRHVLANLTAEREESD